MTGLQQLSPREAYAAYIMGSVLVDVREPDDAADTQVDVKKVVTLPFSELDRRLNELPANRRVVLVSRRGLTSARAARLLLEQGYEDVATLEGGLEAWVEEGLPVRK
jgi:rhodanese-related sulfurtransferase